MPDLPLIGRGRAADVFDLGDGRVQPRQCDDHRPRSVRDRLEQRRPRPPLADAVFSWMLMSTGEPDQVPAMLRPLVSRIRRSLVNNFSADITVDDGMREMVSVVCARRIADPNTTDSERASVLAFAARYG